MSLRTQWEARAPGWIAWARANAATSFFAVHREPFLALVPAPGRLTLDLGAGEGRMARELRSLGHNVVELNGAPTMARASRSSGGLTSVGDLSALPFRSGVADLAISCMSLHEIASLQSALDECGRVLSAGGRLVLAVVHPIKAVGLFDSYFTSVRYSEVLERDGVSMQFETFHHSLETYSLALESAGFAIEALREVAPRAGAILPSALDIRAVKISKTP